MVTCTAAPTGAASGQTVIDPPADVPAAGEDAQLAVVDAGADVAATGALAEGAADDWGADDDATAEALD